MSSFFTAPSSQKKRKHDESLTTSPAKKRDRKSNTIGNNRGKGARRDESISGSDAESERGDQGGIDAEDTEGNSESDHEDETGAERRLRLAERYLENIKGEVDEVGYDAAEIDRDLIAERLKEDVAETKGRLYRHIALDLAFNEATKCQFRADTLSTTSIATCHPYVYTVSKDLTLIKWELPNPLPPRKPSKSKNQSTHLAPPKRRRPTKLIFKKGIKAPSTANPKVKKIHHTDHILCVAASPDGKFVVTGGADKRLVIWDALTLTPLREFMQHRAAITSLVFRRGDTNQLYSASADRTIKTWSLNELAYVETLFGHQDEVVDVAALAMERCLSVGARDRTARLWKVVEETQLVFRGGGGGGGDKKSRNKDNSKLLSNGSTPAAQPSMSYAEGSIDRVAMIDEETFITGSDNGSLSLWNQHKKKPVFVLPLAHGFEPAQTHEEAFAEEDAAKMKIPGRPQPRWITALATVPYSDLILSGSWDGAIRIWRISEDKRKIEGLGTVGSSEIAAAGDDDEDAAPSDNNNKKNKNGKGISLVKGYVNDLSVFERGERGKDGLCIVAAVGNEHRLGRWKKLKAKNGAVVFEVPRLMKSLAAETNLDSGAG
ncbi:pre-rRNA processing protein [Bachmanniomyces sp. S44760]|nr:pre-rRNA processing protein [Bachmanniomyces sp. S44760]